VACVSWWHGRTGASLAATVAEAAKNSVSGHGNQVSKGHLGGLRRPEWQEPSVQAAKVAEETMVTLIGVALLLVFCAAAAIYVADRVSK
jgi:hypothetical protein